MNALSATCFVKGFSHVRSAKCTAPKRPISSLVGSGIASLAAAKYLIDKAGVPGKNIHILEQVDILRGARVGAGEPDDGFVMRGRRMHEEHYTCYWDLLRLIPLFENPAISVTDESFDFNKRFVSNAQARLLRNGQIQDVSSFGLSLKDPANLLKLTFVSENRSAMHGSGIGSLRTSLRQITDIYGH